MNKKKVVLYARVSLLDLNPQNQLVSLRQRCAALDMEVVREYVDHASGKLEDRPELRRALGYIKSGAADLLMVYSIDRLGRSVSHVIKIVDDLRKIGKGTVILRENLDLSGKSPQSDLILHIFSALAEFEAALISERTKTALAVARLKGKTLGRPSKRNKDLELKVMKLVSEGVSIREIARRIPTISRATIQNIIKDSGTKKTQGT